ncbi:putative calpain-like cysteine peptidase [Trypanosoma cruzi]|uniref:Calpain-like cysteine peptidase, putative n=2 Tax=Trypanosoma cruzi TaxID=5693 RepID=Q4CW65_TRYCC|nr:calpain-like cysteine peptidase, putative [Trypanosoma cruzi]EAN84513.1 calpain-like cysteine peptidase, putative [Trypanosoma cruzi]PWV10877.1 putative calpain-like cysteine peptidase [Trypanosoma cruzi]RNC43751.1 calpain-like cysteine peptidase [Trypanosoma cruzi]|eukprot:XP_806364.1 calpain-like cysteine peptidase [Trypanosoma cruzi strain CL Brener]
MGCGPSTQCASTVSGSDVTGWKPHAGEEDENGGGTRARFFRRGHAKSGGKRSNDEGQRTSPPLVHSYHCGGPSVSGGEVLPALWYSDCTKAAWKKDGASLAQDDTVLLYRIVLPRPPYEVWAFYNDTKDIQFYVTIHFYPHPEQRRELLMPLGATTVVWLEDGSQNGMDAGSAVAKLVVGPTETALAVEGHMVAYRIIVNGFPANFMMQ